MPNWKKIKKLRDILVAHRDTPSRKFDMASYIRIISGKRNTRTVTVKELRDNGSACGSAACIAGIAFINFEAPNKRVRLVYGTCFTIAASVRRLLELSQEEADWMFLGSWSGIPDIWPTRRMAVRYLNKCIKEKDVMVRL